MIDCVRVPSAIHVELASGANDIYLHNCIVIHAMDDFMDMGSVCMWW